MLESNYAAVLTRRRMFLLAGAGLASYGRSYAFGKEFWETKDPDAWSSDDIARLLNKSPWAKPTYAERTKTEKSSAPPMQMPMPGPGGRGRKNTPATRREPPIKTVTTYKGTVVWESAAPIRAALKTKLPAAFDGQYVLGVIGVPLTKTEAKGALDRVRQVTTLQVKGKQPLEAGAVQEDTSNGTVYLFGFSREALALSREDKEIVFTTHMGKLAFTAKFNPKDMLYHAELAV
jgi:hypothetical protein